MGSATTRAAADREAAADPAVRAATVDIVIPVYNEERALPGCVEVLHDYLTEHLPFDWTITVVDNASTDTTPVVAERVAARTDRVRVLRLERKGRGLALRTAWSHSTADVVAYMDVDLSTGLDALLPLVAALVDGHSDIAIGSRLAPGARTVRGPKREVLSRCYNALIRLTHGVRFSDAQCGFKAVRAEVARPLLAHVADDSWFFDTELLLLAEHNGLRVHEVPVDWVEDVDSRVAVARTVAEDLRGLLRMARAKASGAARVPGLPSRPDPRPSHPDAVLRSRPGGGPARRLAAFPVIGGLSVVAMLLAYALVREWWPPLPANLVAQALAALLITGASRLPVPGGRGHIRGLPLFVFHYLLTSAALLVLAACVRDPARLTELATLLAATLLGTAVRIAAPRARVFRARDPQTAIGKDTEPA